MRTAVILVGLLLVACDDRAPAPTAAQNDQLNEAEEMLDEEAENRSDR